MTVKPVMDKVTNRQVVEARMGKCRWCVSPTGLLGLLGLLLGMGLTGPARAQSGETPEVKIGRERYPIAKAAVKKANTLIMGRVVGTASTEPMYKRKYGFVLEDFSAAKEKVVVYANSPVPSNEKPVWVRGELTTIAVTGSGKEKHRLFLAEEAKEGIPPEAGGSVAPATGTTGNTMQALLENKIFLAALGALVLGGVTLFFGLLQSGKKGKRDVTTFDEAMNMNQGQGGFAPQGGYPPLRNQPPLGPPLGPQTGPPMGGQGGPPPGYGPAGQYKADSGLPLAPGMRPGVGSAGLGNGETLFDEKAVFMNSEGSETVFDQGETMASLPAYFEVVSGPKEEVKSRKYMVSVAGRMTFPIARAANNQSLIANFIPIKSDMVSRKSENQGQISYDTVRGVYIVKNFADPAQRKNPIKVAGIPMQPNEERILKDGDLVQVGDVVLRFCREAS